MKIDFLNRKMFWNRFRSILSRLLMIIYTVILNNNVAKIFNENLFYLNYLFILLITIDGYIVLFLRNGLEDSWCSFSILFFVTANINSIFMVEINLNMYWGNAFQKDDFTNTIDSDHKRLNESAVLTRVNLNNQRIIDSDKYWFEGLEKVYQNEIIEFETTFCYILIAVRFLMPQNGLTWTDVNSIVEYTFNTLFDVYSTGNLLRETKFSSPVWLTILHYCIANSQLTCISLNIYTESISEDKYKTIKLSPLRKLVENYYFQFLVQIIFAELPFLISRIMIVAIWYDSLSDVKVDVFYSIVKQIIIISCKICIMIHHRAKSLNKEKNINYAVKFNNIDNFDDS